MNQLHTVLSTEDIGYGSRLLQCGQIIRLARDLQVKHLKRWRLPNPLATNHLRFSLGRRCVFFTLGTNPVYWAYLVICGLVFAIGQLRDFFSFPRGRHHES